MARRSAGHGKAILGVIAPIDAALWQQIAHAVSVATR
jgi:hypothetical protein